MESEINAIFVIEVLGRPPEHVTTALNELIDRIGKEENAKVTNKKVFPPKQAENMFIAFAEVELNVKDVTRLAELCFLYMPSSVEIINPYDLKMTLNDANSLLNLLVARLHNYDAIAKRLTIENTILQNQLRQSGVIQQQITRKGQQNAFLKPSLKKLVKTGKPKKAKPNKRKK